MGSRGQEGKRAKAKVCAEEAALKEEHELSVVELTFKPSTVEADERQSGVKIILSYIARGQPGLHVALSLKKKNLELVGHAFNSGM